MMEITQFLLYACRHSRDRSFLYSGEAVVITLELALNSKFPQKLLTSSRMTTLVPPRSTCLSLQIDSGPEHFVFHHRRCHHWNVACGHPRCKVIFAFPFLREKFSVTAPDGKITRFRPLAGSTVDFFGKASVRLEKRPGKLLFSASVPSIQRRATLTCRWQPRMMAKSTAQGLSIPVDAPCLVTKPNTTHAVDDTDCGRSAGGKCFCLANRKPETTQQRTRTLTTPDVPQPALNAMASPGQS